MIRAGLLFLTLLATPTEDRYSLAYRPKIGEATKTNVSALYKVGGKPVEILYELRSEVIAVRSDGSYTAKSEVGTKIWKEEGKPDVRNEGVIEWGAKYNARGEELPDEETDEPEEDDPVSDLMRLAVGYEPKTPVKFGETWTPPMDEKLNLYPLTYTLVGSGPFDGHTELVIEGKGPGRDGANMNVKLWIDAASFARRKAIVRITEAPTATGNDGEVIVTIDSKLISR